MTEGTDDRPQLGPRRIIERPRLTRLLDDSPARIKMLVAPAGYGKTTLARQWLRNAPQPVAWFTAAPSCVDVAALALGLHRAASTAHPGIGTALLERLPVTANPQVDVEILADMLVDDLGSWPDKRWIVIDDYHEIAGAAAPERLIEALLLSRPMSLLVLTRERPTWASARRILYGELFEVGREMLAMNDEEAGELLVSTDGATALLRAAGGWPAAIALAAISSSSPQGLPIASDLYHFFAEELYQRVDSKTRRGLWKIALVAPERSEVIAKMFGPDEARRTIDIGNQQGLLTCTSPTTIEIHPLLQLFLDEKLRQEPPEYSEPLVRDAVEYLVSCKRWDEAFDLISRFDLPQFIPGLVRASLQELLALGRVETLRRWVSRSGVAASDSALGLTAAELSFREGHYFASEVLAKTAAESLQKEPEIEMRSLIAAGRAAHAASRESEALAFYVRAKTVDALPELTRAAAMGDLVASIELELPEA
ncbi:MAG: hypothetical protein H0V94_07570, partial [Actinobacteria bacterium]|nr:hypothetical protein [Actinomycetota bacterium]